MNRPDVVSQITQLVAAKGGQTYLVAAGLTPGPAFGVGLRAAYEAQLEDDTVGVSQLLAVAVDAIEKWKNSPVP